jgi:hypothetical protein
MKTSRPILAITVAVLIFGCENSTDKSDSVNAILGDISYVAKFGSAPTDATDESLRIRTHLQFVEKLLRNKNVSHLSPALQSKRQDVLDLLHRYRNVGAFPKNYDHKDKRVPCFIDIKGNICAVGYLIEQTGGRALAEAINEKFKYAAILSMHDERIDQWISESGLTREECAMIQPAYQWPTPVVDDNNSNDNYISPGYAITSSLTAGINISLSAVNALQLGKGAKSPAAGFFGICAGTGSIVLGALSMPSSSEIENSKTQTLSMVNIGLGATTLVLGICNLSSNRPRKNKSVLWNLYSFPEPGNKSGVVLSLTKKL